jgi:hypothetical protein
VSPVVYDALAAAEANAEDTNAQEAYKNTKAKWTDPKKVGERVDPSQLMTGDVAMWEDERTALVVKFGGDAGTGAGAGTGDVAGAGQEGSLEVLVKGKLVPLPPLMASDAEFGPFSGFAHPRGIEKLAPTDGGTAPDMPVLGDQSAAGAMPVVAMPAG